MKALSADSLMARVLGRLAALACHHPRWLVIPQLVLFVVCVAYALPKPYGWLEFDTNRDDLVGANKKYQHNFLQFKQEFTQQDDLVVIVQSGNPEKNRQFVERLGARLETEANLFTDVFYKGDMKIMGAKALMFVPEQTPDFEAGDFKKPAAFIEKLQVPAESGTPLLHPLAAPADAVTLYLRERLSPATRQALAGYQKSQTNLTPILSGLTNDLNRIVSGPCLYDAQRFSGVTLRPKTLDLLATHPQGDQLALLNRLLLEDAYPDEISQSDLEELLHKLQAFRPFINQFTHATNLVSFFDLVNTQFRTAPREANAQTESLIGALPALERILAQANDCLSQAGPPLSPGVTAMFDNSEEARRATYITFAKGTLFLVTAHAPTADQNEAAVQRLRELMAVTREEVPGLNVGLTGGPVLEQDEMAQSQKDTTVASIVSLILCALIFIYGYNETGRPVKATLCLVVGLAYTLAFATLTVGHLNILTITFVPILIGLAIDYGVHLVTRYEEELRLGKTEEQALVKAMVYTGQGIFTGALTTAGAFIAMAFTDFKGIQEMGIICGGGLLVCFLPMMTLLPVMLLHGRQNVLDHQPSGVAARARIENLWLQRPFFVTLLIVVTGTLAATQLPKVYFDYNLLHMQSADLPAVVFEQKLIDNADKSLLYGAVVADSLPQAVELKKKFLALTNTVADVESIAGFLSADQREKLQLIHRIQQAVAGLQFNPPDLRPVELSELSRTLYSLYGYLGAARAEVGDSEPELTPQLISLQAAIQRLRSSMLNGDALQLGVHADKLGQYQQALFNDLRDTFLALQNQDDRAPLSVADIPPALRNRFVGVTGKYLLQIYPKKDVWQRQNQQEFVTDLRRVYPNVTGEPVQLYEYTSLLKDSYEWAALYSLLAIIFLVLLHFRSLWAVGLSLIPVAIGTLWLAGLMGWLGVPFNPANIMTLPLVIGIGVTNGIHILNRFAEERTPGILTRSTGKAVLVSGLTAIAGFGSLILAKHRGIHSLGFIMASGIALCMVAGLTFLPVLLGLLGRRWSLIDKPGTGRTTPAPGSGGTEVKTSIEATLN
jgi:hopanoid biosynthesis associated RND transporter like protein HpnN